MSGCSVILLCKEIIWWILDKRYPSSARNCQGPWVKIMLWALQADEEPKCRVLCGYWVNGKRTRATSLAACDMQKTRHSPSWISWRSMCKHCFKQHGRKGVNKEKNGAGSSKVCSCPKEWFQDLNPTGKQRPNRKGKKHFHGSAAHFFAFLQIGGFFQLLLAVAVGSSPAFVRIKTRTSAFQFSR